MRLSHRIMDVLVASDDVEFIEDRDTIRQQIVTLLTNARVLGWGVHYRAGRWLVNGSGKGLVALTIEPPVRAKFRLRPVSVRSLWVSVTDPDALIAACAERRV